MRSLKALLIGSSLALVLLTGCLDSKSMGLGRRPFTPYIAAPVFSEAEATALAQWSKANPDLFSKLQVHNNVQATMLRTYMEEAIKVNRAQLEALSYDKEEIRCMMYANLRRMGYPSDHPLVKDYAPKNVVEAP